MKAIITVGISASGKTTFAKEMAETQAYCDINRDWIRFNVVCPGADWRSYKFTKAREAKVNEIQAEMIMNAWAMGLNVVVSDTNLSKTKVDDLTGLLENLGYEVEVKVFDTPFEEAYKRDNFRANGVGKDVLYKQQQNYLEFIGRKTYVPNKELPRAVIIDIDGTVATMKGRSPFEWDKVGSDLPRQLIIDMVDGYTEKGIHAIFVSGRDGSCRELTMNWLKQHVGVGNIDGLFMREADDYRKDTEIKEEIFWRDIAPYYNVVGVIDDRPCVVRMWYELKIPNVICVGNPYVEF